MLEYFNKDGDMNDIINMCILLCENYLSMLS